MTDAAVPMYPDPIPGIITFGTVNIFAGAPGVGKTAMIVDWIARMATGRTIWHHPTNCPTGFYYIAADRQWNSHSRWLELAGLDPTKINHYSIADDDKLDLTQLSNPSNALDFFATCLLGLKPQPGGLLVVDPGSPLFIAGSPNNSRDVAYSLLSMSRMAQAQQLTMLISAHFGKQTGDSKTKYTRPQDRIAGSGAFSGFSDTQIYLVDPDPENNIGFHTLGWNPRHRPPQEFPCTRLANGLFGPWDTMKEDEQAQRILDAMEVNGVQTTIGDLAEKVLTLHGYSRMQVRRTLERLLKDRLIVRLGRGRFMRAKIH